MNMLVFNQLDVPRPCMYSLNSYIFLTILFAHQKKRKENFYLDFNDLIHWMYRYRKNGLIIREQLTLIGNVGLDSKTMVKVTQYMSFDILLSSAVI